VAPGAPVDLAPVPARRLRSALPPHWQHGAFMEIFVRVYADSDGDGIGDLRGLIGKLAYLQALGIKGLWLMPVTASADHDHGYATTDHRAIAPEYGTLADFDELLRQAHRRGIGVIMDYVINHAAAEHPLFVAARTDAASPWRDWFVWSDTAPPGWDIWGKYPWYQTSTSPWLYQGELKDLPAPAPEARGFYFGTFGPHMPDFNLRHPRVVDYHLDSLRFWLERGLDGYRLDAVPHMIENDAVRWNDQPESRALTKRIQDEIHRYPGRYVVCEATAEPQAYGDPAVCGGAFAFGYTQHYVKAALGEATSVQALADYYRSARPTMATFVSNHDIFAGKRLWDQVGGDLARYKLAAAAYLLQPGTPFIYYGEEIGQAGLNEASGLKGDLPIRAPMSWTGDPARAGFTTGTPFRPIAPNVDSHNAAAAVRDPASIHAFYKAMLGLRNRLPSIARGSYEAAYADGLLLGFQRHQAGETSLVLINYGSTDATTAVPGLAPRARLRAEWPRAAGAPTRQPLRADERGQLSLLVPAQSVQVWTVRR
jgi:glycosidase